MMLMASVRYEGEIQVVKNDTLPAAVRFHPSLFSR